MGYLCFAPLGSVVSLGSTCCRGCFESLNPCAVSSAHSILSCFGEEEGLHVVTGGNRGVGYHTARILLQQNKRVIILSRSATNGEQAVKDLQESTGNNKVEYQIVDLGDLSTVLSFVKYMEEINTPVISLTNNAGLISSHAVEVNHVGHFALTLGLLPYLQLSVEKNGYAHVVNVASCAHVEGSFVIQSHIDHLADPTANRTGGVWGTYAASKAANVLFTHSLARYLKNRGIEVSSYHPGVMLTDLWRDQAAHASAAAANVDKVSAAQDSRSMLRTLTFCCVKHPMVSAIGLAVLATPCCSCLPLRRRCPHSDSTSTGTGSCAHSLHSLIAGSSGGYYQQCLCCSLLPVRPSPLLTYRDTQDLLWRNSLQYLSREHAALHEHLQSVLTKYDARMVSRGSSEKNDHRGSATQCDVLVSPAWPGTECLAAGPYCVCVACLC